ncbi:MAG: type II toxin-antitoxin system HicA family toxin [Pyrinomonadaceae bacterium]
MKRRDRLRHLREYGCELLREGASHSWWHNQLLNMPSAVPRHTEINENLVPKICKDLGVPKPQK